MEIIKLHHPYNPKLIPKDEVVLVLGFFDGVHLGHQEVIRTGARLAVEKGLKLALLTFNQHASKVCAAKSDLKYLMNWEQKAEQMAVLGVDYLYQVTFTSAFSKLRPQDFVRDYIVALHAKVVVAGYDYTYGPKEIANMRTLPLYAANRFEIVQVAPQLAAGAKIGSSRIRNLLAEGKLEKVNELMGRPYQTRGLVVHGEARGRTLGYPTANLKIDPEIALPKEGIYAVCCHFNDKCYLGMASIGYNVTFGNLRPLTVEVNILDFNEDIYGETLIVDWYHLLREEQKFASVDDLVTQLALDEKATRNYFQKG